MLEILECYKCGQRPEFHAWPNKDFPTLFYPACACAGIAQLQVNVAAATYTDVLNTGSKIRKASLSAAIRKWNKRALKTQRVIMDFNNPVKNDYPYVTCRFCPRADLIWGRRSYISKWKPKVNFVLYERVDTKGVVAISHGSSSTNRVKHKEHRCLSLKNIVSQVFV